MQPNSAQQPSIAPPAMEALEMVFDPVMRLAIRLTAVAKPRDPDAFERLLGEFAVAVIREAFEHQDEIRARLGMVRPRVEPAALPDDFIGGHETSSTGAEADRPSAGQQTNLDTAAGAPPSAPSTSTRRNPHGHRLDDETRRRIRERYTAARREQPNASQSALVRQVAAELGVSESSVHRFGPAAEPNGRSPHTTSERTESTRAALPIASASAAPAAAHEAGTPEALRSPTIAEPASPPAEGATCRALSGGDAGAPPAVPPRGAEESQAADETQRSRPRDQRDADPAERQHENSHDCWCRKAQCSTKNPWCKIAPALKPIPTLAGLQERPPRADRYRAQRFARD